MMETASARAVCRRGNPKGLNAPELFADLVQHGINGWELVSEVDRNGWTFCYFKRLAADA